MRDKRARAKLAELALQFGRGPDDHAEYALAKGTLALLSEVKRLNEEHDKFQTWRKLVITAVEAQACDDSLWRVKPQSTAREAYLQQSLLWLHRVIEDRDTKALQSILAQSETQE
ncbi:MAG: hypothetical protein AB7G93_09600 [Bdellovibrionales bacterium]